MADWGIPADNRRLTRVRAGSWTVELGDRVRLAPRARGDVLDIVLAGRAARVEAIEQDFEGRMYVVVTVDDDPGRDLGMLQQPGHRFYFYVDEITPLDGGGADGQADRSAGGADG